MSAVPRRGLTLLGGGSPRSMPYCIEFGEEGNCATLVAGAAQFAVQQAVDIPAPRL